MKFRFGKIIAVLAVAGIVAACNNKAVDTAPDKLVRDGLQKMWTQDNKFNFSGTAKLEFDSSSDSVKENKNSVTQSEQASQTVAGSDVNTSTEVRTNPYSSKSYQDLLKYISSSFTINFTGAVDFSKGKAEIVPEYRYEAKNALSTFKFPIQVDVNKLRIYIDASAITNFTDTMMMSTYPSKVVGDRYILLAAPKDRVQRLPIGDLIKDLPKAMDDGFASIDPKSFAKVNIDDYGKKVNAKYQVQLNTTMKGSTKTTVAMLESLSKALQQQGQEAAVKKGQYQQQDYLVLKQFVDNLSSFYKHNLDENNSSSQYSQMLKQLEKMSMVYDYYFDEKGRVIAMRGKIQLGSGIDGQFGGNLKVIFEEKIDYSTPKFTMEPNEQNTYEIKSHLGLN